MSRLTNRAMYVVAMMTLSCTATYLFKIQTFYSQSARAVEIDDARGIAVFEPQLAGTWSAHDRLNAYSAISGVTNVAELDALLARLAAEPSSTARDFLVFSALSRLYEISPLDALQALSTMRFESKFVSRLFFEIARSDPQVALESISLIELPGQKLVAAAAILDANGSADSIDIDLVASALPNHLHRNFRNDAIRHLASRDPLVALELVRELPDRAERVRALNLVGEAIARSNPDDIQEICGTSLPPSERSSCSGGALLEWLRLDPLAVFDHYNRGGSASDNSSAAILGLLAASDPENGILLADRLGQGLGILRSELQAIALLEIATADPGRAISLLERGDIGALEGPQVLESLAKSYAARDPAAALDWVESLDSNRRRLRAAAVAGVGQTNLAQAIKMLSDPSWEVDTELASMLIVSQISAQPRRADELASLLEIDHPMRRSILERLVPVWLQHEPIEALTWINRHVVDGEDAFLFRAAARSLASVDVYRAAEYISLIPTPEARREWASAVVEPFARRDPDGVIRWMDTQYGEPWHDEVLQRVAVLTASTNPRRAAMLLTNAGLPVESETASRIAVAWSGDEPAAAAQWAVTLQDARSRSTAVTSVVQSWIESDAVSAERWVVTLPRGELRDDALGTILLHAGTSGDYATNVLEGRLLESFSSANSRHSIVGRIAPLLADHNPDTVTILLDAYVTDPVVRENIEQDLKTAQ